MNDNHALSILAFEIMDEIAESAQAFTDPEKWLFYELLEEEISSRMDGLIVDSLD